MEQVDKIQTQKQNTQKYRETRKKYYLNHKDKLTEDEKIKHKEYIHNYYLAHKDKFKEKSKNSNERVKKALKLLRESEIKNNLTIDELI